MEDFLWSLEMTALGMGTVFLLLFLLMFLLIAVSSLDRLKRPAIAVAAEPEAITEQAGEAPQIVMFRDPSGLTQDEMAAISVAVTEHAEIRRKQGAPVHRAHAPGSRLWASRWVAVGRAGQMNNTQRR